MWWKCSCLEWIYSCKKTSVVSSEMNLDGTTYKEMTVEELKVLCKESGIDGYSTLKKAELIKVLKEGTN